MKFSPTATLAFALTTGIAGSVLAQSTTTPATAPTNPQPAAQNVQSNWQPGQGQPNFTPPPTGAQMQPGSGQAQAAPPQQPAAGQSQPNQMQSLNNPPPAAPPTTASDEQVRQAQQQLQTVGLYNGPVDGIMDPDTRAAIARFQQQHGLRRTQTLDRATLSRLMSDRTDASGTSAAATPAPAPNPGQAASPPTGAGGGAAGQSMDR